MAQMIGPDDPEWEEVAARLYDFMGEMDRSHARRLQADEISFRRFCAYALEQISAKLGYAIANIDEFVRDMSWAARKGFQGGVERARKNRLRQS
ncbi:hypothetical protein APR12_003356 [Nocardia amikacinitolerans]|uniref:hypothetical protein n=1 Tax=Nocardia amikacinitolerans TaxID=756689 RepID=UPI00082F7782|nr:hypothetical protein [Nocardia amikacinitolerans]MCP2318003.1 hypothetical protein [Nocardia amikacinitolerans]